MDAWIKVSLLLCLFGFLKEFRPSEPFIVDFLASPRMNYSDAVMNQDIFPTGTYSNFAFLLIVLLVTDLFRYKPIIVTEGVAGIICWALLSFCTDYVSMMVAQLFYGLFIAAEVAYFTYIYAKVDREHYQKVTSHTRTAYLLGRSLSATLAQILMSTYAMNSYELNFISLGCLCVATIWALMLPPANRSLYFHREESDNAGDSEEGNKVEEGTAVEEGNNSSTDHLDSPKKKDKPTFKAALKFLWNDFKTAYTNMYVVKWSVWWALATCGYLQIITYVQLLYEAILEENNQQDNELYNGGTEALSTLLGACAALACGWLKVNWESKGEAILALCSLVEAAILFVSSASQSIWLAYACYILFVIVYHAMFTITNAEVAKNISEDSYGLIFGSNTMFSLLLQTIFTIIVMSGSGLALGSRQQYYVYGGYFTILGVAFGVIAIYSFIKKRR